MRYSAIVQKVSYVLAWLYVFSIIAFLLPFVFGVNTSLKDNLKIAIAILMIGLTSIILNVVIIFSRRNVVKKLLPMTHRGDGLNGLVFVSDLSVDSPFYKEGARKNDQILAVNNCIISGYFSVENELVQAKERNLPVSLLLLRWENQEDEYELKRIQVSSVQ